MLVHLPLCPSGASTRRSGRALVSRTGPGNRTRSLRDNRADFITCHPGSTFVGGRLIAYEIHCRF